MKRVLWLIPAVLLLSVSARAQEAPSWWEFSGGYSYMDADLGGSHFHMNGGGGSATENVNNWFGGRLEVNVLQGNENITVSGQTTKYSVDAQTITYGPVFSYRHFSRITPFAHVQVGAVHGSTEYLGISQPAWKFAMAPGVGFDFAINQKVSIRVDGEYLLTRFLSLTQENVNVSAGVVLHFGHH